MQTALEPEDSTRLNKLRMNLAAILIAEGVPNVASLVFGEGEFDRESLYAACTFRGGGKIWRVPVGITGAPVQR